MIARIRRPSLALVCAVAICLIAGTADRAAATDIQPGFDLFESLLGTEVDLSVLGLGVIPLDGVPLAPNLGTTDTIVERRSCTAGIDSHSRMSSAMVRATLLWDGRSSMSCS